VDPAYESTLLDFYLHSEADLRRVGKDLPVDITRTYYLENDIVLEQPWVPIGVDTTAPFKAAFDGQGHTVTIKSFDTSAGPQYVGFFGYVDGAEVVKDMTILYNGPPVDMTYTTNSFMGLVAGRADNTLFRNLRVRGNLSATSNITAGNTFYMGGVAGYGDSLTVDNCHVSGNVIGDVNNIKLLIGGIAGSIGGSSPGSAIVNTSFTGRANGESGYDCIAGGITGFMEGDSKISFSYANARVDAFGANAYAGGIAGELGITSGTKKIETCYAWAKVRATGNTTTTATAAAGGIAGRSGGSANTIEKCYARDSAMTATGTGTVTEYAGGIIGDNNAGTIQYCAALNNGGIRIEGTSSPSAANKIAGTGAAGISDNWASEGAITPVPPIGVTPAPALNGNILPENNFQPPGTAYGPSKLNWTFNSSNWKWISGYSYPALYWQDSPPRDPWAL
jgi:hypothetical protein